MVHGDTAQNQSVAAIKIIDKEIPIANDKRILVSVSVSVVQTFV
jgi:hypothetical protein